MANSFGISVQDTISSAMEGWLYKYKKTSVKVSTFTRLITSYNLLKEYNICTVRLFELCTADIQSFINSLVKDGYALSTIKKEYNLLTGFVKFALGEGLAIKPAYLNVNLPKSEHIKKQAKQIEAYEPDEQDRLKRAISTSKLTGAQAALLMMETGARVGEILSMRWSDILWQRRAVRIHSTLVNLQSRKRSFVQDSAKSKSSKRTIPLSSTAMDLLNSIRKYDSSLIFSVEDGNTSIGYNTLRNHVMAVCQEAGVEYRGMHVFRHTFATNAFYKGCDIKILSKLLGHASVTITYNTYIHLYGDALEEMRSIVG